MLWVGWALILVSAVILAYNWSCVVRYWRTGEAPGFAHIYGGIPAGVAIAMGWVGWPRWTFWLPFTTDPAGGLYLLGFLRHLLSRRN